MNELSSPHGPYDTSAQAFVDAAPLNAAIHAVDPGLGPMTNEIRAGRLKVRVDYLTRALDAAGVELGEYDRRIAAWLADWETETLQVLVGWIERAHAAGHSGGNLAANWAHHVAAQRELKVPTALDDGAAPMHLGDLVAGEWAPACGQPYGADVTSERAAVTCPACVELRPPARQPEPGADPDGGAPCA